jgi:hypothetical protein
MTAGAAGRHRARVPPTHWRARGQRSRWASCCECRSFRNRSIIAHRQPAAGDGFGECHRLIDVIEDGVVGAGAPITGAVAVIPRKGISGSHETLKVATASSARKRLLGAFFMTSASLGRKCGTVGMGLPVRTRAAPLLCLIGMAQSAEAMILFGLDNTANPTDSKTGVPVESVGFLSSAGMAGPSGSAVHLGGGYMLTANHAGMAPYVTFDGATFYERDRSYIPTPLEADVISYSGDTYEALPSHDATRRTEETRATPCRHRNQSSVDSTGQPPGGSQG